MPDAAQPSYCRSINHENVQAENDAYSRARKKMRCHVHNKQPLLPFYRLALKVAVASLIAQESLGIGVSQKLHLKFKQFTGENPAGT
jgi:hypothetical protein